MNIIEAMHDENLFRPFLGSSLETWRSWEVALRAVYGLGSSLPTDRGVFAFSTGRNSWPPHAGFNTALFLTGRRSGKSRTAAIIGAYEAALAGHDRKLAPGERGVVPVVAPTKAQGRIVRDYIRALFNVPLLRPELAKETNEGFDLRNGNRIEIMAGDFRTIRGYTLLAAVVDEACFFGYEAESKIRSDTELVRAIKPSLATVGGKLIAISSPYAKKGWCYQQYKRHFGNNDSRVLVWNCSSRTMNPTLPQQVIDDAMAEDPTAARSEYLGEFRDDVTDFINREIVEQLVVSGCAQRMPRDEIAYMGFADLSGGRADDAALSIAHMEGRTVVVDYARRWQPPFNPHLVIEDMAADLRRYRVGRVIGDNYAADFVKTSFQCNGIDYEKCDKPKSMLYTELLPRLCSGEIKLPDNGVLVDQLASLERRTRAGGRDIIDHPAGGKDDLANAVAGVAVVAVRPRRRLGALFYEDKS